MNDAAIISTDLEFNWQYAEVLERPPDNYQKLSDLIARRTGIDNLMKDLFYQNLDKSKETKVDFECYRSVVALISEKCKEIGDINDQYAFKYLVFIANECGQKKQGIVEDIAQRVKKTCEDKIQIDNHDEL